MRTRLCGTNRPPCPRERTEFMAQRTPFTPVERTEFMAQLAMRLPHLRRNPLLREPPSVAPAAAQQAPSTTRTVAQPLGGVCRPAVPPAHTVTWTRSPRPAFNFGLRRYVDALPAAREGRIPNR